MYRFKGYAMPKTLSPEDIIKVRNELQLSVDDFANLLDVSFETVRSWESGRRGCKGPAALLIRMIGKNQEILKLLGD